MAIARKARADTLHPPPTMYTTLETAVRLIASPGAWMEGEALRQFYACASRAGVRLAVGFPDLHPGKGVPVGAAFVTEDGKKRRWRTSRLSRSSRRWRKRG